MRHASLLTAALVAVLSQASPAQAAPPTYRLEAAKSTLGFSFIQAGASNKGHFGRFDTTFAFDPAQLAASRLEVSVQIASLDTGDKDRDSTLKSPDLFDAARFPAARFLATVITRLDANRYQASGKLTIRDVTRDLNVPFTFRTAPGGGPSVATMAGEVLIRRLDYGVGQGEWKSTEGAGNEVTVSFTLTLHAP